MCRPSREAASVYCRAAARGVARDRWQAGCQGASVSDELLDPVVPRELAPGRDLPLPPVAELAEELAGGGDTICDRLVAVALHEGRRRLLDERDLRRLQRLAPARYPGGVGRAGNVGVVA